MIWLRTIFVTKIIKWYKCEKNSKWLKYLFWELELPFESHNEIQIFESLMWFSNKKIIFKDYLLLINKLFKNKKK
jgi:hypothetical protein